MLEIPVNDAYEVLPIAGVLFALVGRALDMASTWLVTPTLKLEGNPHVRKHGWKVAIGSSALFAIFGYVIPPLGVVLGTLACLCAFQNTLAVPVVRHIAGAEATILATRRQLWQSRNFRQSVQDALLTSLPVLCLGLMLLFAVGFSNLGYAACVGYGCITWCCVLMVLRVENWVRFQRSMGA